MKIDEILSLLNKKKEYDKSQKLLQLASQIDLILFDNAIKYQIEYEIWKLNNYYEGKFTFLDGTLIGSYNEKNKINDVIIFANNNCVKFVYNKDNSEYNIKFQLTDSGSYIEIEEKAVYTSNYGNKKYVSDNNIKTVKTFDNQQFQQFNYVETMRQNYFVDKKTNKKTFCSPSSHENFIEKEYMCRVKKDVVILKRQKNHIYHEALECTNPVIKNEDKISIGYINQEDKKIENCLFNMAFSKELHKKYLKDQYCIEELEKETSKIIKKSL